MKYKSNIDFACSSISSTNIKRFDRSTVIIHDRFVQRSKCMQNPSLLTWISQREKADIHMTPSPFWRWIIFTKHTQGLLRREFASIFFSAPPTTRIACLGKALYDFWCDFTRVEKHLFHAARQSGSNFTLHELLHIKSYPENIQVGIVYVIFLKHDSVR